MVKSVQRVRGDRGEFDEFLPITHPDLAHLLRMVNKDYNLRVLSVLRPGAVFADRLRCPLYDGDLMGPIFDDVSVVKAQRRAVREIVDAEFRA